MSHQFSVGQKLFFEPSSSNRRGAQVVTVTKVGRKWVSIDHPSLGCDARFDRETLQLDGRGYASAGQVWLSVGAFQAEQSRRAIFYELRCMLQAPNTFTLQQLLAARAALMTDDE